MLGVLVFRLNKRLEKKIQIQYKYMMVFLILNIIKIGLVWVAGYPKLDVIPPILVVVYEVPQKPMYNGKIVFKQGMALTISATLGTLLYFTIDSWILITLLAMILMIILLSIVGYGMPAVYAFPFLSFIFSTEIVARLPISALVASVLFFGSVLVYKKVEMKRNRKDMQLQN